MGEEKLGRADHEGRQAFSIGLVLAGAATGGSYSAGVLDFLLEALLEWEKEKEKGSENVPDHNVELRVMSGTSAGGITATVGVSALCTKNHTPLRHDYKTGDSKPLNNKLWDVWVDGVNLESLLATTDLEGRNAQVHSLASSDYVPNLAKMGLDVTPSEKVPNFARTLDLYLTVANLRGVPYQLKGFEGNGDSSQVNQVLYEDWMKYHIGLDGCPKDAFPLDLKESRKSENWESVTTAAMATGAYPIVFGAVDCSRPRSHYDSRFSTARPSFPANFPTQYKFHAVDGGMFNVRPLEITRKALMEAKREEVSTEWSFSKAGSDAEMASIMIDPFPESKPRDESTYDTRAGGVFSFLGELFSAMLENGRFKEDELEGAYDDTDYSKFIISPHRTIEGKKVDPVLAASGLNHFAGFLDVKMRAHDFVLGRRNAQQFLKKYFVVPQEEAVKNAALNYGKVQVAANGSNPVPVIPLVGTAAKEIPEPVWPSFSSAEKSKITERATRLLDIRLRAVTKNMVRTFVAPAAEEDENRGGRKSNVVDALITAVANLGKAIISPITDAVRGVVSNIAAGLVAEKVRQRAVTSFKSGVEKVLEDF
eukprot:Plantae.Rhodophyta-Hildenbrandia_rubra.ctg6077.p1 GENE.Plantae.Rhodophyta-Hildenbrandia_rubra.ctg6077~~Plantae.Rhodophyta-Hildenbrandia_rubra.ctg6077.p1  ORF type:complete len:594 (-),score=101.22 Plantae.Rhodophyta-Hildenbrandia_rubra.ctg6077:3524-5305(-)